MGMTETFILDTGALIALERGQRKAIVLWHMLYEEDLTFIIPTAVLAEWWHPGIPFSDKILRATTIKQLGHVLAKQAGTARASCGKRPPSAVDAIVMTLGDSEDAIVYTSDLPDMTRFQTSFPDVELRLPN